MDCYRVVHRYIEQGGGRTLVVHIEQVYRAIKALGLKGSGLSAAQPWAGLSRQPAGRDPPVACSSPAWAGLSSRVYSSNLSLSKVPRSTQCFKVELLIKRVQWNLLLFSYLDRVSVQGVKSLGGHFACLCRGFEFYEVKKKLLLFFKKKMEILLHFLSFLQ